MVPETLIKKLNLKKLDVGQSFVNNCHVYLWPNAIKGAKIYMMDCDLHGKQLPNNKLSLKIDWFTGNGANKRKRNLLITVTEELISNQMDAVLLHIKAEIEQSNIWL
jgi:hypothetical protein